KTFPGSDSSLAPVPGLLADFATLQDPKPGFTALSSLYYCDSMSFHDAYKALLDGASRFHFSHAEKGKIAKLFFSQAASELPKSGTLMSLLIDADIAHRLVGEKFITLSDPLFIEMTRIWSGTEAIKNSIRTTLHT